MGSSVSKDRKPISRKTIIIISVISAVLCIGIIGGIVSAIANSKNQSGINKTTTSSLQYNSTCQMTNSTGNDYCDKCPNKSYEQYNNVFKCNYFESVTPPPTPAPTASSSAPTAAPSSYLNELQPGTPCTGTKCLECSECVACSNGKSSTRKWSGNQEYCGVATFSDGTPCSGIGCNNCTNISTKWESFGGMEACGTETTAAPTAAPTTKTPTSAPTAAPTTKSPTSAPTVAPTAAPNVTYNEGDPCDSNTCSKCTTTNLVEDIHRNTLVCTNMNDDEYYYNNYGESPPNW